jgi:hypothetical protein
VIRRHVVRRAVAADGYSIAIVALSAAIVLMLALLFVGIALPDLQRAGMIAASATTSPSDAPRATAGIDMGGAIIPGDAQCGGCHLTGSGTIGLDFIPLMGHPLEGWSKCTACHASGKLVETAAGHSGIHATQCTVCHKAGDLPAPLSRPHRVNQNVACLSCHGSRAPLPTDMTHRKEAACWICHRLPVIEPPVPAHETATGETDCLTCHVAGGPAGGLPGDHIARPASLCLSCHEVALGTAPGSTPRVTVWPAPPNTPAPLATPLVPIAP